MPTASARAAGGAKATKQGHGDEQTMGERASKRHDEPLEEIGNSIIA